jgi:hypothetical protein
MGRPFADYFGTRFTRQRRSNVELGKVDFSDCSRIWRQYALRLICPASPTQLNKAGERALRKGLAASATAERLQVLITARSYLEAQFD